MAKRGQINVDEKYIKWLSELSAKSGTVAGGKGANLAEMYNVGLPVPPAFVITAQTFDVFLKFSGLKEKIKEIIEHTNVDDTEELEENAKKIREIILASEMPKDIEKEILEAYEILGADYFAGKFLSSNNMSKDALSILKTSKEPIFVAVRSSATTEDLSTASFAGQQETYTNIKGWNELLEAVKKCFASLYTSRAIYYRHKKGFGKADALIAVVVQKMINSDKSGVIFTKNPVNEKNEIIIEAVFGLGEGIVSGKILPDYYAVSKELKVLGIKTANKKIAVTRNSEGHEKQIALTEQKSRQQVLSPAEIISLANLALRIEQHYKKPQDIEFSIESGNIYIVQTRPITTFEVQRKVTNVQGEVLLTGLGASPGVASGKVRVIEDMSDLKKVQNGDVLVTKMTNPDMVVTMQKCSAIVTDEGGTTAHAAIVSREMGIPCLVGTEKATKILKDGMIITVDGTNGKVHSGSSSGEIGVAIKGEVRPINKGTRTKIKVMIDLPDFAERAAKSGCDSVGLLRLEGIIAGSGKHPLYFLRHNKIEEYIEMLEKGIDEISRHFKEIWVRTSDIRTDEFRNLLAAPKEIEINPMLGFHGIRFSLKYKQIMDAELSAIKRIAQKYPEKKFGIMFPQIISESEIEQAYKIFRSEYYADNIKIGAMIETPAAVQIIRKICKFVKFISFGTNDLTQYTLAIDRGNSEVQYLYNEMHPAVLLQIKRVIDICKEYKVETSICGQAGSNKEMVKYLVKNGIDSISVNADTAYEISGLVAELEGLKIPENSRNGDNMAKRTKENEQDEPKMKVTEIEVEDESAENKKKEQKEWPDIDLGFDVFQAR